jgi:hypothetical protein
MVEGSKAHLKKVRVRRRARKEVGLGNALPWMVEKRWWKNTKRFFFRGLILVGGLLRLKFLKGEKISKAISNLATSRWPSI